MAHVAFVSGGLPSRIRFSITSKTSFCKRGLNDSYNVITSQPFLSAILRLPCCQRGGWNPKFSCNEGEGFFLSHNNSAGFEFSTIVHNKSYSLSHTGLIMRNTDSLVVHIIPDSTLASKKRMRNEQKKDAACMAASTFGVSSLYLRLLSLCVKRTRPVSYHVINHTRISIKYQQENSCPSCFFPV